MGNGPLHRCNGQRHEEDLPNSDCWMPTVLPTLAPPSAVEVVVVHAGDVVDTEREACATIERA